MVETVLGVDPSLKDTGLCMLSLHEGFVVFDRIHFEDPIETKTFDCIYNRITEVDRDYRYFLDLYRPDIVIMESPLPEGQMSPALSALATKLTTTTLDQFSGMFMMHPSYLRYILGKKAYSRKDIVELTESIIQAEGFKTSATRYSADEGVAFLLAYRILLKIGHKGKTGIDRLYQEKERYIKRGEECEGIHLQRMAD